MKFSDPGQPMVSTGCLNSWLVSERVRPLRVKGLEPEIHTRPLTCWVTGARRVLSHRVPGPHPAVCTAGRSLGAPAARGQTRGQAQEGTSRTWRPLCHAVASGLVCSSVRWADVILPLSASHLCEDGVYVKQAAKDGWCAFKYKQHFNRNPRY